MTSRPILTKVMHNLNLSRVWGAELNEDKQPLDPEETLRMLQRAIRVEQDRDTTLMNIRVTTENSKQSAEIANEIANVYQASREQDVRRKIQNSIDAMSNELRLQQERVEEAENKLEKIRSEKNLLLVARNLTGSIRAEMQRIQQLEQQVSVARVEMIQRKTRLDELNKLEGDELLSASVYTVGDPTLVQIRQQYMDASVSLKTMLADGTYGENHPEVKRLKGAIEALQAEMQKALSGLKHGLATDYEVSKSKLDSLENELKALRDLDIEQAATDLLPFDRASREVDIQRDILTALRARVTQTGIELEVPRTMVHVVEEAEAPERPSSPIIPLNIILSVVLGLLAGVGLAFFVEYLDVSLKTVDEVEKYLGLSVLAVIPQQSRPLTEAGHSSGQGEAYRGLRTSLALLAREGNQKVFTVVSGGVGEGKSTTLFNLSYVYAEQGSRVLVIDSDMRRPVQHKMVGLSNKKGLVNVLMGELEPMEAVQETGVPNLSMMTAGRIRRGTLGIMNGPRVRALLDTLKPHFDVIMMDAPPILGVTDAAILASEADGVLLVVQYRKYPKLISLRAKRMVENAGGHLMGAVLNNINIMRDDYYYYYHYTTKKYYGNTRREQEDDAAES